VLKWTRERVREAKKKETNPKKPWCAVGLTGRGGGTENRSSWWGKFDSRQPFTSHGQREKKNGQMSKPTKTPRRPGGIADKPQNKKRARGGLP